MGGTTVHSWQALSAQPWSFSADVSLFMRVGIHFGDFSPDIGGAHTVVAEMLAAFCEVATSSAHEFILFCDSSAAEVVRNKVDAPNVLVVPVPSPTRISKRLASLHYLSPVVRLLSGRRSRLDRLAGNHGVQLMWFVGVGVYESPDIPYIATVWDLQHRMQPFFPEVSARGLWDKRDLVSRYFLGRAAYCVTGTETGKREIEHFYGLAPARVRVMPLPTPSSALYAKPSTIDVRKRFGFQGRFVLYPAQFWPHKNHVNLILALKMLREQRGLDLALVLPGSDKGNLSFVKEFCRQNATEEHVHFPGFVSTDELIALYREAELLAFVSYFGPDNIPPLEAFALGCPVVCSSVDGAAEQYGNAAVLVEESNPAAIADAIESIITDRALKDRLVASGRIRAKQRTSVDYAAEMVRLFDEFARVRRNWP
jgi:glycosyltransferase involved in cell wall biosynthesis